MIWIQDGFMVGLSKLKVIKTGHKKGSKRLPWWSDTGRNKLYVAERENRAKMYVVPQIYMFALP